MNRIPSMLRIIRVDYLASIGWIAPLVVWGIALATRFFDPEAASFFGYLGPTVTVFGLLLIFWRSWVIRSTFEDGDQVPGTIVGANFFRGRGRVVYVYTYQSEKYQASNAVQLSSLTRSLTPGKPVTVVVSRLDPKRAFIHELYL